VIDLVREGWVDTVQLICNIFPKRPSKGSLPKLKNTASLSLSVSHSTKVP